MGTTSRETSSVIEYSRFAFARLHLQEPRFALSLGWHHRFRSDLPDTKECIAFQKNSNANINRCHALNEKQVKKVTCTLYGIEGNIDGSYLVSIVPHEILQAVLMAQTVAACGPKLEVMIVHSGVRLPSHFARTCAHFRT